MAGAVALVLASVASSALDAGAQSDGPGKNGISVVQVEGLLDPPTVAAEARDRARTSSAGRCS
jgi:hypothetical protein